jgi:hypothetical protein
MDRKATMKRPLKIPRITYKTMLNDTILPRPIYDDCTVRNIMARFYPCENPRVKCK